MGEHREKHLIFSGPFADADPMDTARLFLRTNRYTILDEELGPAPSGLEIDPDLVKLAEAPADGEQQADADESDDEVEAPAVADDEDDDENVEGEEKAEERGGAEPDGEQPAEILTSITAERGNRWAGFTSSNMSELRTRLSLKLQQNTIRIDYTVTTTGQFLSDDERKFWSQEAAALERFLKGAGDPVGIVSEESERAARARRDLLGRGLWIAVIVFVVVLVGGLILARV